MLPGSVLGVSSLLIGPWGSTPEVPLLPGEDESPLVQTPHNPSPLPPPPAGFVPLVRCLPREPAVAWTRLPSAPNERPQVDPVPHWLLWRARHLMRSKVQSTRARAPRGGIWAAGAGLAAAEAAQQSAAGPICRGHPFSPGPGLGCSSEGLPSRIFASPTWNPTCKAPVSSKHLRGVQTGSGLTCIQSVSPFTYPLNHLSTHSSLVPVFGILVHTTGPHPSLQRFGKFCTPKNLD